MKTIKYIGVITLILGILSACKNTAEPEIKTVETATSQQGATNELDPNATYTKVEFGIEGMTCEMGCAKTIEKKMAKLEGVKSAKVDFGKKLAMVEYDEAIVTPESLKETVAKAGDVYKVKDMKKVETFNGAKGKKKVDCPKDCCKSMSGEDKKQCEKDCKKECNKANKA